MGICSVHWHVGLDVGKARSRVKEEGVASKRVRSRECSKTIRFKNTKLECLGVRAILLIHVR